MLSTAPSYEARQSFACSIATIGLPNDSVRSVSAPRVTRTRQFSAV